MGPTSVPRAVNDSCSLQYLFWGHFPPAKHKIAWNLTAERTSYKSWLYNLSLLLFLGNFLSFVFRRVRPNTAFFFAPLVLVRQKFPCWEKLLSPFLAGKVLDSLVAGRIESPSISEILIAISDPTVYGCQRQTLQCWSFGWESVSYFEIKWQLVKT